MHLTDTSAKGNSIAEGVFTMTMPYTQADLLALIRRDHSHFTVLTTRLSDGQQTQSFTQEGWSCQDFLDHMIAWNTALNLTLLAYLRHQPWPPIVPGGDEANAERRQACIGRSLEESRRRWEEVHAELQLLVQERLDDTRLMDSVRVLWDEEDTETIGGLIAEMMEHDREHFDLIRQHWLAQ
jgi:hypothetical protein